jgi:hypothetical protein
MVEFNTAFFTRKRKWNIILLSSTELQFFQKHGLFDLGYSLSSYFDPQLTMIWGVLGEAAN